MDWMDENSFLLEDFLEYLVEALPWETFLWWAFYVLVVFPPLFYIVRALVLVSVEPENPATVAVVEGKRLARCLGKEWSPFILIFLVLPLGILWDILQWIAPVIVSLIYRVAAWVNLLVTVIWNSHPARSAGEALLSIGRGLRDSAVAAIQSVGSGIAYPWVSLYDALSQREAQRVAVEENTRLTSETAQCSGEVSELTEQVSRLKGDNNKLKSKLESSQILSRRPRLDPPSSQFSTRR